MPEPKRVLAAHGHVRRAVPDPRTHRGYQSRGAAPGHDERPLRRRRIRRTLHRHRLPRRPDLLPGPARPSSRTRAAHADRRRQLPPRRPCCGATGRGADRTRRHRRSALGRPAGRRHPVPPPSKRPECPRLDLQEALGSVLVADGSVGRPGLQRHGSQPGRTVPDRHLPRRESLHLGISDGGRDLTRDQLVGLLTEVGQFLLGRGEEATIYVIGGAAMAIGYQSRRVTRDVDAALRSVAATPSGKPRTPWASGTGSVPTGSTAAPSRS